MQTTHDWELGVDAEHLEQIRRDPATFAPGGLKHLVLELLAYVADEGGNATITQHPDGSISVTDDGRGTEVRRDEHGRPVRKPVMATKDLRFFDNPDAQRLPDGHPRRGASVVAALSAWLIDTSRRPDGAWTQRYEHGRPVTGLQAIPGTGRTGTTVHFRVDEKLVSRPQPAR